MSDLAPLAVAVPLLDAALLALLHPLLRRLVSRSRWRVAAALASAAMSLLLLVHVGSGLERVLVRRLASPRDLAIGIDFAVEPIGAGLAAFVALLMVLALLYSTRSPGRPAPLLPRADARRSWRGWSGSASPGDLFNMFVFFELMSVSAVALVAYKVHEQAALEGGLNFAVINTIGAFLFLLGIGLIYAHTGALNLAQIGRVPRPLGNDRVIVVAFTLLVAAFLIKAAVVPFHFWLDDAYAVALAPVCLLLAGAMSEMGLYGLARIWFGVFCAGVRRPARGALRVILVGAGLLTAVWGAAMALERGPPQAHAGLPDHLVRRHLPDRASACSPPMAWPASAVYVLADGFGKAAAVRLCGHRAAPPGPRGPAPAARPGPASARHRRCCSWPPGCSARRCRRSDRSWASR